MLLELPQSMVIWVDPPSATMELPLTKKVGKDTNLVGIEEIKTNDVLTAGLTLKEVATANLDVPRSQTSAHAHYGFNVIGCYRSNDRWYARVCYEEGQRYVTSNTPIHRRIYGDTEILFVHTVHGPFEVSRTVESH